MQQEQAVVDIDIADGSTRLTVGRHVGQFVVLAESLTAGRSPYASRDIEFLADDVFPDAVNGLYVRLVTCQCCHIGHTGIHVGSPHGMSHRLVLLHDRLVALRVLRLETRLAAVVQQELGFIEVFLLARGQVQTAECHLRNLVSRYYACLSGIGAHLTAHTVRIAYGDVQELARPRGLPVCHSTLHHVPQVVEFMAQVILLRPTLVACPVVRVLGVHGTCRVEVAVRFLSLGDDVQHTVYVGLQTLVGVGLEYVTGSLDGLVGVRVIEGVGHDFRHIVRIAGLCCPLEVLVSSLALALAEGQWYGHLAAGLEALSPETGGIYLDGGEGNGCDGVAGRGGFVLGGGCRAEGCAQGNGQ